MDRFSVGTTTAAVVTPVLHKLFPSLRDYLLNPGNRHVLHHIIWITCVIVFLFFSAAALLISEAISGSYKPGMRYNRKLWMDA
jgi:hypothetical protein